ncbi:MAG: hypothetical protein ACTSPD_21840, partial [Promethearchaeota archaeon]
MKLVNKNTPERFWRCNYKIGEAQWSRAIIKAAPILDFNLEKYDIDTILYLILGEGQFGQGHWSLNFSKRIYYEVKPFLPRLLTKFIRRFNNLRTQKDFLLNWPIERRYVDFLWQTIKNLLLIINKNEISFLNFWPNGNTYAFVLTHDVETKEGQDFVREIADLEEEFGFHSSFNFIQERYSLNFDLISELRERGFEIGIHGLKHDGKLFNSYNLFVNRASRINYYLRKLNAIGFRSPLMHRHPEWLQLLDIEYDLSFFDTDPFEPLPGGTMCLWPFELGHFIELPYTLVQDYTLTQILGEKTPKIWLDKIEFIKQFHGMALLNTHPDYLRKPSNFKVYFEFVKKMYSHKNYWHALPREVAKWWRNRSKSELKKINGEWKIFPPLKGGS